MKRRSAWLMPLVCLACAGANEKTDGEIVTVVQFMTAATSITRVTVSVTPAGVNSDLTVSPSDPASFSGILTVPAGSQTVSVAVYATSALVGTGTAPVTVVKGQQAQVNITVVDTSGGAPVPDHSPVITSFVVPATTAQIGDQLSVSATAFDDDGDTVTPAWSASPSGCGTFAAPGSLSTTFTAATAGSCAITFTATAKGKSDTKSTSVVIGAPTGTVSVTVTYVAEPVIDNIALAQGATQLASISRTGTDATTHAVFHKGTAYTVTLTIEPAATGSLTLTDSCSGTIAQPSFTANSATATATWTPTVNSGACVLTAGYTRLSLSDSFPIVVLPVP